MVSLKRCFYCDTDLVKKDMLNYDNNNKYQKLKTI